MRPSGTIQVMCPSCGEFTPLTGALLLLGDASESIEADSCMGRDICRECNKPFKVGLTINIDILEKVKESNNE